MIFSSWNLCLYFAKGDLNDTFHSHSGSGNSGQPSTAQLRMLVQQIQMAVSAGYLNHQILNQPLAPQTLVLLNQLLQQVQFSTFISSYSHHKGLAFPNKDTFFYLKKSYAAELICAYILRIYFFNTLELNKLSLT